MAYVSKCNDNGLYLPEIECNDCSTLVDQVLALESAVSDLQVALAAAQDDILALQTLIGNKQDVVLAMTDESNNVTSVTVLAE